MTDEGQLDFDGLLGDEPAPKKKPTRKRKPTKPVEAGPEPEPVATVEQTPETAESPTVDPAAPPTPEPTEEVAPEAAVDEAEPTEPVAVAEVEAVAPPEPRRLFFLTNRMNLNGILSSRVLAPRESFHKYYADLLELCPGWVPLLTAPPTAELVERVVAERGAGAPVLVELSESVLSRQEPDGPVTYVRAGLLADVVAIHFREEKSLREHRARGYSNVHPHEDLLRVSPELFTAASEAGLAIAAPDEGSSTDWLQLDRARGAVNALLAAVDNGESLAVVAGALGAPQVPEGTTMPPWLTWDGLTGAVPPAASESDAELADRLIFQTAYRILGERDQTESWSPSEVLETVASEIAAIQPNAEAQRIVDVNLQRVRELVNVERDFEPFRHTGNPHVAAKSFLMVLLRPDLGQLLEWPAEETGADDTTRVVAAVLAGRLRGLARESVKLRHLALDDLTAAWAVGCVSENPQSLGTAKFEASSSRTLLTLDGVELKTSEALAPDSVTVYEALSPESRLSSRVAVSRRLGWPVTVRVHIPSGSDVQMDGSVVNITSSESVHVETAVDENDFVGRLQGLTSRRRREVNNMLAGLQSESI